MLENDLQLMKMAYSIAKSDSNDPRTNTGAVISKGYKLLGMGANSSPKGLEVLPYMLEKENKKYFINHAERKAIAECSKYGNSTRDATMHLNWEPCSGCALEIIDAGINELVLHKDLNDFYRANMDDSYWLKDQDIALKILKDVGVKVRYLEGKLFETKDNFFINFRGEKFFP
jgi:deoxycytidylate deaminase